MVLTSNRARTFSRNALLAMPCSPHKSVVCQDLQMLREEHDRNQLYSSSPRYSGSRSCVYASARAARYARDITPGSSQMLNERKNANPNHRAMKSTNWFLSVLFPPAICRSWHTTDL